MTIFEDPLSEIPAPRENTNRANPAFGRLPEAPSLAEEARRHATTTMTQLRAAPLPAPDPELDARLLEILDTAPACGETIALAYHRKESALREAFASLDILASRAMHVRLSDPRLDDALASKFSRLTGERRARLLAFLAGARRRAAMGGNS